VEGGAEMSEEGSRREGKWKGWGGGGGERRISVRGRREGRKRRNRMVGGRGSLYLSD